MLELVGFKNIRKHQEEKMDALKIIEQSSMKAEAPKIEIGDFVKVSVRIKEGDKMWRPESERVVIW